MRIETRRERIRARIERLKAFAKGKDLSLYGEAKSGIPLGQPILVGHHSERRHRRHLERIERMVRAGFDAQKKIEALESTLASIGRNMIASDNPDAKTLLAAKIVKLEQQRVDMKEHNKLARKNGTATHEYWKLANLGQEISRYKKRLDAMDTINAGFGPFEVNGFKVEIVNFQVQVTCPYKPNQETRNLLKRTPIALKWSTISKKWVRKHTETTSTQYYRQELIKVLEQAKE